MEAVRFENFSFTYPGRDKKALDNVSFAVNSGEFVTICGKSGCGKTTLLRMIKTALAPSGEKEGKIVVLGKDSGEYSGKEEAGDIGFVMQSCDNQIVTDKVWHELAFGLESLGKSTPEIRARVSEMASFFGIENWFYKNVEELSGGQKQLLNLASVMVMQPKVLVLDEPTSQLDPIAAEEFLNTLRKINRELSVTVVLSEHRLEEALPISDRVVVMDEGKITAQGTPGEVGRLLYETKSDMFSAMPAPIRVFCRAESEMPCPVTIREGRLWLESFAKGKEIKTLPEHKTDLSEKETVVEIKDAWFRYKKELPDVIKGLNLKVGKGEIFAIVGGNGTGKTTALSLVAGLEKAYRGGVYIKGTDISRIENLHGDIVGMLPQNPQSLLMKKTVYLDLADMLAEKKMSKEDKHKKVLEMASLCHIESLLESHPYDLSGGEQQRAALAKMLLLSPEILLLDEPTKGFDAHFKEIFAEILQQLKAFGVTIIMVSHDIEFCAKYADRCALFFDGNITSLGAAGEFFCGKSFYTTAANKMARTVVPGAVLAEDIIYALGGTLPEKEKQEKRPIPDEKKEVKPVIKKAERKGISPLRIFFGVVFALLFALTLSVTKTEWDILGLGGKLPITPENMQIINILLLGASLFCFIPRKKRVAESPAEQKKRLSKRTLLAALFILIAVPVTIYIGIHFLEDRKYYFISLMIILETMIPFFVGFEKKKPKVRELIIISVLCAIAICGRAAFTALPQFKPVLALVIICGVCFGGETGFLVGSITAFVSNFIFGQGPWTPWQMFANGMVGFVAGILFSKGLMRKSKVSLAVFGFISTFVIFGGIINPSYVIMWEDVITPQVIFYSYIAAIPFDLVHAVSTAFFLWFISEPMIEKLERVKIKYGIKKNS